MLKRPETSRTGIYILIGDDPESVGGQMAYIGEGDDVSKRLYQHARPEDQGGKDFWDRAIVITSKDTNLTKAHARYLESRFISLGLQANRAKLTNSTAPEPIVLPEADVSDMEYFIEQARIVLPVLGVNIFRSPIAVSTQPADFPAAHDAAVSPVFELRLKKQGILATAQEIDGEFTVLADSTARLEVGRRRRAQLPRPSRKVGARWNARSVTRRCDDALHSQPGICKPERRSSCRDRAQRQRPQRVGGAGRRPHLRRLAAARRG